jgi:hypothetical protein
MKIGITLGLKDNQESIWTNGIKQNVLMLVELLKKSTKNYDVCILNSTDVDFTEKPSYLTDIDIFYFNDKFMEMDLIICMGAQIFDHQLETFKKSGKNKKVVSYKCGNNYVIHMENILFKPSENKKFQYEKQYDEVWYVPQQHEVNSGLYKTLYRVNAIPVPFIWSEKYLHESVVEIHKGFKDGKYKKDWQYDNTKEKKILGIMEPNLNIVKFCLIPAMIAEESYRTSEGRKRIDKLRITNATAVSKHREFMSIIETFDLYKEGFSSNPSVMLMPAYSTDSFCNCWLTSITLIDSSKVIPLIEYLEKFNIESRPLWKPMHLQPFYQEYAFVGNKNSDNLFIRGLCLPSDTKLFDEDIEFVIKRVNEFCRL